MKKIIELSVCFALIFTGIFAFSACSNTETWKCVSYDFVADDGSTRNMLNVINLLTLTINNDNTCVLNVTYPDGPKRYEGTWSEENNVIKTKINADWSMEFTKTNGKLISIHQDFIDKAGVSTIVLEKT